MMPYQVIEPKFFINTRRNFCESISGKSIALFFGSDLMLRTADQMYPFRQNSNLFYLTGIDQSNSILLLYPNSPNPEQREILFIKKSDEKARIWEGENLSKEEAKKLSGIDQVCWTEQYESIIAQLMPEVKNVYLNLHEPVTNESASCCRERIFGSKLKSLYPLHRYRRSQPILRKMRMKKSPVELELIRKAISITASGFNHVLTAVHPNMWEYQIEAILSGTFIHEGARGHAFEPIVASGSSACILHYTQNSRQCRSGDLILLDFGAEYANYAADISRTIPVNGRFSSRQAQVYDAVLHILEKTRSMMVPGITLKELNREVGVMMNHALIDLGLLEAKDLPSESARDQPFRKYFMHGVSHHLGLDVHDLSDRAASLEAGMVLTCEPGIYISQEKIGVRLENDILVHADGPVDLSEKIPIQREEIESLMQR
ncbi:MAG: M24 family metallopeptidase [Saprospiraceae bacterium]|nr:M24 family metallopeptidase [Saprospiraceae bacterium]